jgi:hypothetical protein
LREGRGHKPSNHQPGCNTCKFHVVTFFGFLWKSGLVVEFISHPKSTVAGSRGESKGFSEGSK